MGTSDEDDAGSIGPASDKGSNECVFASKGLAEVFRLRTTLNPIKPTKSSKIKRVINEVIMFFAHKVTKTSDTSIVKEMSFTA